MQPILSVSGVSKTYDSGHQALKHIDLDIRRGEIFALLGPNGAGKTTLIGIICGLVRLSTGTVTVDGHDIVSDYRTARSKIGLVPQEMALGIFDQVYDSLAFSRGLFGRPKNPALVERVLRDLSLWDKRKAKIQELSGGMKRRVLIGKALVHEPEILFLDEPTAGVDVELRREMWDMVRQLRDNGVTIILTTHYIEEAEEMADRIGVINKGELIIVEDKRTLMTKLGQTTVTIGLPAPVRALPDALADIPLILAEDGTTIRYATHSEDNDVGIANLVRRFDRAGLDIKSIDMHRTSLEDIFVDLVEEKG